MLDPQVRFGSRRLRLILGAADATAAASPDYAAAATAAASPDYAAAATAAASPGYAAALMMLRRSREYYRSG